VAIEGADAIGSYGKCARRGAIGLVGGSSGGLWVEMHAHELKLEAVEMGDVWNEVREVRELARRLADASSPYGEPTITYSDPEDMFHVEILGSCLAIQLHHIPERCIVVLGIVGVD
jgi:hypothetical protein